MKSIALALVLLMGAAAPASAQLGGILKGAQKAKTALDINITEEEEQKLGSMISEKVRARYGVVQNAAVHKYVALVGTLLAQAGTRPSLPYTFIVLDTDAVNAFAAPGGYIHITRAALGLIRNEAELAAVLGHEMSHVTDKHTVKSLETKARSELATEMGAEKAGSGLSSLAIAKLADLGFDTVLAGFGRGEELEADRVGVTLASKLGYAPTALGTFLTRLTERNNASTEKRGLFASHPAMKERLTKLDEIIARDKLSGTAMLDDRYKKHIKYEAPPITEIAVVAEGTAGLAGGGSAKAEPKAEEKKEEPAKKRGFGLGRLVKPSGEEKKTAQVTASGGARGVTDPEVGAKGGPNPAPVAITVTAAEIEAFKKEGKLAGA